MHLGRTVPMAIPEGAVQEGAFSYWIEEDASGYHIMCGGAGPHYEIQPGSAWYPDEIYEQEQEILHKGQQGEQN